MATVPKVSADSVSFTAYTNTHPSPLTGGNPRLSSWGNLQGGAQFNAVTLDVPIAVPKSGWSATSTTTNVMATINKGPQDFPPGYSWQGAGLLFPAMPDPGGTNAMYPIAVMSNRAWFAKDYSGSIYYQVSEDLSAEFGTPANYTPSVSSRFGPYSPSFTYNANALTFTTANCGFIPTASGGYMLQTLNVAGTSITFLATVATAGGAPTFQKAFSEKLITRASSAVASTGVLATYPYMSGAQQRYLSLVLVDTGTAVTLKKVDWAPTAITNTVFDSVSTALTLSDAADNAVVTATDTNYTLGSYNSINTTEGAFTSFWGFSSAKYYQFNSTFTAYREIIPTGTVPLTEGLVTIDSSGFLVFAGYNSFNFLYLSASTSPSPTYYYPKVRAWGFSQDDHDNFVLRLGNTETLVYDAVSQQWSVWDSGVGTPWRANYGVNWQGLSKANIDAGVASDVIVGDDTTGTLWSLDPDQSYDDQASGTDTDPITTTVTTGYPRRGSTSIRNNRVFLALRTGDEAGSVELFTSDDGGETYQSQGVVALNAGEYNQEVVWRSLGKITYPGRVFRFDDDGSSVRLDGVDTDLDDEDV